MFLQCGSAAGEHVETAVLDNLTELPELANRLSGSRKLWLARAIRQIGTDDWLARQLLPATPAPDWITVQGGAGVWQIDQTRGTDAKGFCRLKKVRGADPAPGDIFMPLWITESTVTATVTDSNGTGLSDIQIYVRAGGYPDEDPVKLRQGKPAAVTDHFGKATFVWKQSDGPAYLLIVRNRVALAKRVVAPTTSSFQATVTLASRWRLGSRWVGLDEYVVDKAREVDRLIREHERRMAVLNKARKEINDGKRDEAMRTLRQLDPSDPDRVKIENEIAVAKTAAGIDNHLHLYRLAMGIKDYDKAIQHLTMALALAGDDRKGQITAMLDSVRAQAKQFQESTQSARQELFTDLPRYATAEIVAKIADIERAVDVICAARSLPALKRTYDELGKADGLLTKAIDARLAEMKAGRLANDDPTYKEYDRIRDRLRGLLRRASDVLDRTAPRIPATAPAT